MEEEAYCILTTYNEVMKIGDRFVISSNKSDIEGYMDRYEKIVPCIISYQIPDRDETTPNFIKKIRIKTLNADRCPKCEMLLDSKYHINNPCK